MKKLLLFFTKNPKKIWHIIYEGIKLSLSLIFALIVMFLTAIVILILIPFEMYNKKNR